MSIVDIFKSRIQAANNIVITTHIIPDADGIGSEIALCMALRKLGKQAVCVNDEPLMERYRYLDPDTVILGHDEWMANKPDPHKVDLWIVVDTNTVDRVGPQVGQHIGANAQVLYVDHHPAAHLKANTHCVDIRAAATGQLAGEIIEGLGLKFDSKMALPLYTSIIIDTSSFRYPNVTGATHRLVGDLMDTGISPPQAYNGIYGTKKIEHMHLLGTILATAQSNSTEEIAWIHLSKNLIKRYSGDVEDTHAFINHLLILDNIKVACMFRDDGDTLKVSLRSSGDYDVGLIAKQLGGGGHSHSAATILHKGPQDKVDDLIEQTIKQMEQILAKLPAPPKRN